VTTTPLSASDYSFAPHLDATHNDDDDAADGDPVPVARVSRKL